MRDGGMRRAALALILAALLDGCSVETKVTMPRASSSAQSSAAVAVTGSGCAAISGSIDSMASKPVVEAVASNYSLSILGGALKRTDLAASFDQAPALTLFAPTNAAFAKLPSDQLHAVLGDPKVLAETLKQHVVSGRLSPEQLPGTHATIGKRKIKISDSGGAMTVNGLAHIICGNIRTSNAVIYLIDAVLMPK